MMTQAAKKPAGEGRKYARAVKFLLDREKTPSPEEVARVVAAFKKRVGRA